MDEFPTGDEEFELLYGDELELLRSQEEPERTPKKSRKSLDFAQVAPSTPQDSSLVNDFTPIPSSPSANVSSLGPQDSQSTNKRTIEELFGDIDDLLYDNQTAKRHKGDPHADEYALIDHIVELRRLAKERRGCDVVQRNFNRDIERDRLNLSKTVPNYPFVKIKKNEDEQIYIRCHSKEYELEESKRVIDGITLNDNFLSKDVWKEAQELLNQKLDKPQVEISEVADSELWVDLYKPRKYIELLSDESTNRVMLKWVKLWDKVVFKRRPRLKLTKTAEKSRFELNTQLDEDGRPFHKVALLCGPPGLGKTTLAHIVAKHAGYNVVEVNASDDRSLEAFKTSLENATQMRSVLDGDKRPNCLIFDEIDGAPPSSIDYLVKFVTGVARKGKKKGAANVLKRPIICICNDAYVPSLRPLRQIAFVVNFPQTSNARLADRLMQIARWQNIKTDTGTMMALAEKSQNDIRSCLSVLHFFKSENKPVTLTEINKSSVGQKDIQKGIFSVWHEIFFIERSKDHRLVESLKGRMNKVLDVVHSFGDYEKVAQGVFENYTLMNFKRPMQETCVALEWFSFSDLVNREIYSKQAYYLSVYLQYAFVGWHFAFGSRNWQKLQYPHVGFEVRTKRSRQRAIVEEVLKGMPPLVRSYVHAKALVLDVLPLLSVIISPGFRPISLHLYTDEERKTLEHVVTVMIDYNLTYVQERTPDGHYVYKLDPNIYEVVSFGPKKTLSYSNMQLISQEIEATKLRQFENKASSNSATKASTRSDTVLPNHLQKLKARKVNERSSPAVVKDFFGRIISTNRSPTSSSGKSIPNTKYDIWYQYKEGYNNAVRKKIKISTLK